MHEMSHNHVSFFFLHTLANIIYMYWFFFPALTDFFFSVKEHGFLAFSINEWFHCIFHQYNIMFYTCKFIILSRTTVIGYSSTKHGWVNHYSLWLTTFNNHFLPFTWHLTLKVIWKRKLKRKSINLKLPVGSILYINFSLIGSK